MVEKFSEAHTSIQWSGGVSGCPALAGAGGRSGGSALGCPSLRASVDRAVANGEIPVSHVELPMGGMVPRLH